MNQPKMAQEYELNAANTLTKKKFDAPRSSCPFVIEISYVVFTLMRFIFVIETF